MSNDPIYNPFDEDEKAGKRPFVWAIMGVLAACLGLLFAGVLFWYKPDPQTLIGQYFPSPTPSRTSTPAPTATHTPTSTPNWTATAQIKNAQTAVENATRDWEPVIMDDFEVNNNDWLTETSESEYSIMKYEIVNGKYRWETTALQSFIGWVWPEMEPLTNFYLSVEIQQVEGPDTADYGVLLREDEESNFYYFGISQSGSYALYIFFEEWETLIDWTETDLIAPGTANRITVLADGPHFTFFINDQYLTEFTDNQISEGIIALAIELSDEGDQAIFEFDNFELRAP